METNRQPRAIIYLRVSSADQADSGFGLKGQLNAAKAALDALKRDLPGLHLSPEIPAGKDLYHLTAPGIWVDDGVSAHSVPLIKRPVGRQLLPALQNGDVLICAKFDRTFRTMIDMVTTLPLLGRKGVRIVFADQPHLDTGNASGKATLNMWATMAQFSSDMTSERMKETQAIRASSPELKRKLRHVTRDAIKAEKGNYQNCLQRWHLVLIRYYLALRSKGMKGRDLFDRIAWVMNKRWNIISKPIEYMDWVETVKSRTLRHFRLWERLRTTCVKYGWYKANSPCLVSTHRKVTAHRKELEAARAARTAKAAARKQARRIGS